MVVDLFSLKAAGKAFFWLIVALKSRFLPLCCSSLLYTIRLLGHAAHF
jgi:hypothetical protein